MGMLNVGWWRERLYGNGDDCDPVAMFLRVVEEYLDPSMEVLDLGAGAGELNHYDFKGRVRRMTGIDIDPRVKVNPLLDNGLMGDLANLPFEDNSFDMAFCIYVLEHMVDPERFAREVMRILRPGGMFLGLTPNRYHYVPLLASLLPDSFHRWYNKKRGRPERDTFPTVYRLNTRAALVRCFERTGFILKRCSVIEVPPNYLEFCVPAFLIGAAYERIVNATESLADLRVNIICAFQKDPFPTSV